MSDGLLTPKQLAAHYNTSNKTVLEWYHKGIIPAEVSEGAVYRFDLDRVKAALAKRAKKPAPSVAPRRDLLKEIQKGGAR